MHKKEFLLLVMLFCLFKINAQVKDNLKLGIDAGVLLLSDSDNLGFFLNVEPKLKSTKNTFIGLRIGVVLNAQKFDNYDPIYYYIHDQHDNGGFSFVPTMDYYFKGNDYRPYIGGGAGVYLLANYVEVSRTFTSDLSRGEYEVNVDNQLGVLFRTGLESSRFRIGLEYNLVSKADIQLPNGETIGTVDNSYFGLSIGGVIGGGKSSR